MNHFRRNMLDLAARKTKIRTHDVLDATIESLEPPKFSRQASWSMHEWMTAAFIASSGGGRYTPVRPNSMTIRLHTKGFRED